MPFVKVKRRGKTMYRGPSGRVFTRKQVRMYYARGSTFDSMTHDTMCRCNTCDAKTRKDPTGTSPVISRFNAETNRRYRALRSLVREALGIKDVFGLTTMTPATVSLTMHLRPTPTGNDKARAFTDWVTSAVAQIVGDGRWSSPYVVAAFHRGIARAQTYATVGEVHVPDTIMPALMSATANEVTGASDAAVQAASRMFAAGLLGGWTRNQIMRAVVDRLDKVGATRTRQSAAYGVVNAFNTALLAGLKSVGHTQVGITPERLPTRRPTGDAVLSAALVKKAFRAKKKLEQLGEVNVLTAEDDDVCPKCEAIAENGPYDIDHAQGLIPAHAHCRCAFQPAEE